MGGCHGKHSHALPGNALAPQPRDNCDASPRESPGPLPNIVAPGHGKDKRSNKLSPYSPATAGYPYPLDSPSTTSGNSTPLHRRKLPFPPPSPAKHIKALLRRRAPATKKPNGAATTTTIPEKGEKEEDPKLDKSFGYPTNFKVKYELGDEVGRGHFGYTCSAKGKKGELKGKEVAVKVIPKAQMRTAIGIEDVRREVKILSALTVSRHENLIRFFEAFEDEENVYIVMEMCKGGELLDMIISRGGRYSEEEAKAIIIQILSIVSFCHLQGVVHRDLKPENFLYVSKDESSCLKLIDFGLSEFVRPDGKLNDIVGSAYYVAPEVLHRSYGIEADMWSVGVIAYILLSGHRPFYDRTESGIFRAIVKTEPKFHKDLWASLSTDANDFVKRLLQKDHRKRMSACQALHHPWIYNYREVNIPLDLTIYRNVKAFVCSSSLRKSALRALAKTLNDSQLSFMYQQFQLLGPTTNGFVSVQNFKTAVLKNWTEAMKESRVLDFVNWMSSLQLRMFDFEEFAAAALSVHQLELMDCWEEHVQSAYEVFETDGNRPIKVEELAVELGLDSSIPLDMLHDWVRYTDGKLNFLGYAKLLHGRSSGLQRRVH